MIPHFGAPAWPRAPLCAAAIALALGGCSLAPVYQRPPLTLPPTLGGDVLPAAASVPAPVELTPAERAFVASFAAGRDLVPLVARTLAHNADYRLAVFQVAQARAQYRVQQADRLPTLGAQVAESRQHFDSAQLSARYEQKLVTATTGIGDFELDFFGRMKSLADAARERYLSSTYGQQAARGALVAEVLRAYTLERMAAATQAQAQAIAADSAALLVICARQHEVGLAAQDELELAQARADQAAVAARQAADDRHAALRALRLVSGYDVLIEGDVQALAAPRTSVAALQDLDSQLLLQRPDIRQAEAALRAANADIGAARAAFFPAIRLSTSMGIASDGLDGLFHAGSHTWSFAPQVSLPLFDFGRNRANLDLAWTRQQAGVVDYEKAIQAAFREVADALDAHATLAQAEQRQSEQDTRAQRRVERMTARATAGLADRVDLVAERIRAEQSALSLIQARRDLALSRIALFHAFYGVELPSSL